MEGTDLMYAPPPVRSRQDSEKRFCTILAMAEYVGKDDWPTTTIDPSGTKVRSLEDYYVL